MRACSNLVTLDQAISDAVKTRQEVDLRIGEGKEEERGGREMDEEEEEEGVLFIILLTQLSSDTGCAFTRFQTMRLCKAFPHILEGQLISYGPCQFPTLGFVVERVSGC